MQLLARQSKGGLILAKEANKRQAYQCLECGRKVRLRGGMHRQLHFYHVEPIDTCRQHQKGMVHLQVQLYFYYLLGEEDCLLEHHMPEINRIADVAWLSEKIVFEIQYSSISAQEVRERNQDYLSQGWKVVWILHDRRFNQPRYTAAEEWLRDSPHYYTNMDQHGQGIIYDQFDHLQKGWRRYKLEALQVQVKGMKKTMSSIDTKAQIVTRRAEHWPHYFEGDVVHLAITDQRNEYIQKILEMEEVIRNELKLNKLSFNECFKKLFSFYKVFFHHLLEKSSR